MIFNLNGKQIKSKLFLSLLFIVIIWTVTFGFKIVPCNKSYEDLEIPEFLIAKKIILEEDAVQIDDSLNIFCRLSGGTFIRNKLVLGETSQRYYERNNKIISTIKKGKQYDLVGIKSQTEYGISAIDSGPGPLHFLILKDDKGESFLLYTVNLEDNAGYYEGDTREGLLSWELFENIYEDYLIE